MGTYPIPEVERKIEFDHNNQQQTRIVGVVNTNTGYAYPFSKQKLEEIHKNADDKTRAATGSMRTKYYITNYNKQTVQIFKYEDFLNGDFDDLYEHGKMTKGKSYEEVMSAPMEEEAEAEQEQEPEQSSEERQQQKQEEQADIAETRTFKGSESQPEPESAEEDLDSEGTEEDIEEETEAETETEPETEGQPKKERTTSKTKKRTKSRK